MALPGVRGPGSVDRLELRERQASTRPSSAGAASSLEDRVTLSSAARPQVPERFRALSSQAHSDPKLAEQLAHDYALTEQSPIIDLSDLEAGRGPAKYAATGEPVTFESEQRYKEMAASLREATASLYSQEKAKGTADADILDKLLSRIGAQPQEFRNITGWGS